MKRWFLILALALIWPMPAEALSVSQSISLEASGQVLLAKRKKRKKRKKKRRKKKRKKRKKKKRSKKRSKKRAKKKSKKKKKAKSAQAKGSKRKAGSKNQRRSNTNNADKSGIAVMSITAVNGVAEGVAKLLNELVLTRLKSSNSFSSVMDGSMLELEQQEQFLGCDGDNCLSEFGEALGVPLVMTAQLGRMGDQVMVTMKVIAIEQSRVMVRSVEMAPNEGALPKVFDRMLSTMLAELFPGKQKPLAGKPKVKTKGSAAKAPPVQEAKPSGFTLKPMAWAGMGLVVVGSGVAGFTAWQWGQKQDAFDDKTQHTSDDLETLIADQDMANTQMIGAAVFAGVGAALTAWGW